MASMSFPSSGGVFDGLCIDGPAEAGPSSWARSARYLALKVRMVLNRIGPPLEEFRRRYVPSILGASRFGEYSEVTLPGFVDSVLSCSQLIFEVPRAEV